MNWPPTAEAWTAFWTFFVALGTVGLGVAAWIALGPAKEQLEELRAQRAEAREHARAANRAYVVVTADADRDTRAFYFKIENAGKVPAERIRIEFHEPIKSAVEAMEAGSNFDDPALLNPPLLAPGHSYRTLLDHSKRRKDAGLPMRFEVTVKWMSKATDGDRVLNETYVVDFNRYFAMREWSIVDESAQKQLRVLERIADALEES